jgi:TPR repeat protein
MINSFHDRIDAIQNLIRENNDMKSVDVSAAVYLLTHEKYDYNHAIHTIGLEYNVFQLTKTHFVFLKVLDRWENLGQEIASIKSEIGDRSITILILNGHGEKDRVQLGEHTYCVEDVSANDFRTLDPRATIIVNACRAGQILAGRIATVQERRVIASISDSIKTAVMFFQERNSSDGYMMASFTLGKNVPILNAKLFRKNEVAEIILPPEVLTERVRWLQDRAQDGSPEAQYFLGWHYELGFGITMSHKDAFEWCMKAAEQEYPAAQSLMGWYYYSGDYGVEKSLEKAFTWFTLAAEQGDSQAQYWVGDCYENGFGISKSYEKALNWYKRAADQGHHDAQNKVKKQLHNSY